MAGNQDNTKTETVTKTVPRPPSNLYEGMPIADGRVGIGKGGGKWLLVLVAIVLVGLFIFFSLPRT